MSSTDVSKMEVDQENMESLGSFRNLEQNKDVDNASSSEDEGIFVSHNPHTASCDYDAKSSSSTSELPNEVDSITQKPLDVIPNASEPQVVVSDNNSDDDDDDDDINQRLSVARRKTIVFSDDEESNLPQVPIVNKVSLMSDDDDADSDGAANNNKKNRIVKRINSDSEDDDYEMFLKRDPPIQQSPGVSKPLYKYNSDLFDAELSDEDQPTKNLEDFHSPVKPHGSDEDSDGRFGKVKNKKPKKQRPPSFKEKQQEVKEIHSETQRMVRESQLSLPYHKPKQRTLTEFLNRRKKIMLPKTNMRSSLKMSMRNMETLRLLEEKKKEVEEFYKSDSDQEDPGDKDWVPDNEAQNKEASSSEVLDLENDTQADMTGNENILYSDDELPDLSQVTSTTSDKELNGVSFLEAQETHIESELPSVHVSEELVINEGPSVDSCDNNNESDILSDVPSLSEHLVRESENNTSATAELNINLVSGGMQNDKNPSEEEETCVASTEVKGFSEVESLSLSAEDSGLISTDVVTSEIMKTDTPKLNLIASKLPDLDLSKIIKETPKLSLGGDDDFIDLEETTPKNKSGVNELMDRFVRHSNTKRKPAEKKQVNLSVVSKEKDDEGAVKLVSSNVVVNLDAEEDDQPTETIPGARLVLLKTALRAKIREQRERERMRRVKEKQFLETEQVIQDYSGDLPDEEAELTDQSETDYETESEPEENDIIIKDKKHQKCKYVDDEAEDDDEDEDMNDADEGDNSDDDNNGPEVEQSDSNDTVELPSLQKSIILNNDEEEEDNEKLRLHWEESQDVHTLAQATSSDVTSVTHSNTEDLFASHTSRKVCSVDKDSSTLSMDSSFELFGSVIPGHQPGGGTRHGTRGHCNESDGDTAFLTPFTKTKSGSCSRAAREHDLSLPIEDSQDLFNTAPASAPTPLSPNGLSLHLTPLKDSQFPLQESHKKTDSISMLRLDFSNIGGSQEKDDLIGLCSGQFTGKVRSTPMKDLCEDNLTPTQDINELMGLCSGQFAGYSEEKRNQVTKNQGTLSDLISCQDNPDEDHHNAEEELLGLCTAKFTMQATQEDSTSILDEKDKPENGLIKGLEEDEDTRPAPMIVFSSDEEGMAERQFPVKRRKKRKRIVDFSDDEDAQDAIVFDDEENEITRTTFSGFKDKQKGGIRADFLENEAELSGSDVNSADEDDDADSMEEEEGDYEHYDENELRDQVGRAHLKTLLDSDKQQVRLLQEMYLEDGELHGEGRQRQFRWKNVGNDADDNEKKLQSDDEEGGDEEMEDAEWRKQRFEREKFLNEQRAKQTENHEAEVFKIGRRPIVRSTSLITETSAKREPLKTANPAPVPATALQSKTVTKNPFSILSKRGSFLSRDKTTLARIAEFTKDTGTVVGGAKQGGNFVFQQLSAEEVQKKTESTTLNRTQSLPSTKRKKLDRALSLGSSNQSSSIFRYI